MRYREAIERLFALQARGMRLGIERMQDALRFRGLSDPGYPIIQVAGTNGKGSVSAMIASGLRAAGLRTGLFTSPHLHRFTERISIDGAPLPTRAAARKIGELLELFGRSDAPSVSFFELSTLIAVEAFRDRRCDVAVLEVGLGGRLDATTALPAALGVITRIAFDHTHVLGTTLSEIATQKAGIIRPGVPVIVGSREREAQRAILARARELHSPVRLIERDFRVREERDGRVRFETRGEQLPALRLSLLGRHQHDNAACALAALLAMRDRGFVIPARALGHALTRTRWPARLERIPGRPAFLLDAAHNADGCQALAAYLASLPRRRRVLIFGAMADKDYPRMLELLAPQVDDVVYVQPQLPRALEVERMQAVLPGCAAASAGAALRLASSAAGSGGLIVIAGSIFVLAELRAKLLRIASDPLIRL